MALAPEVNPRYLALEQALQDERGKEIAAFQLQKEVAAVLSAIERQRRRFTEAAERKGTPQQNQVIAVAKLQVEVCELTRAVDRMPPTSKTSLALKAGRNVLVKYSAELHAILRRDVWVSSAAFGHLTSDPERLAESVLKVVAAAEAKPRKKNRKPSVPKPRPKATAKPKKATSRPLPRAKGLNLTQLRLQGRKSRTSKRHSAAKLRRDVGETIEDVSASSTTATWPLLRCISGGWRARWTRVGRRWRRRLGSRAPDEEAEGAKTRLPN